MTSLTKIGANFSDLRVGPLVRSKLRKKYFLGVFEVVDHDFLGFKSVATSSCLLAAVLVIVSNQIENYFFGVFRCGKNNAENFSFLSISSCLQCALLFEIKKNLSRILFCKVPFL